MNETPSQEKPNTQWGPIIRDLLILMCVMGMLGYACKLAMEPFEVKTPTDSLVSLIRKGDVKLNDQGQPEDAPFLKELAFVSEEKVAPEGVNTPDVTGRTPLMWAVYSNYNDPVSARDTDNKRLYYVFKLLDTPGIQPDMQDADGFTALHWAAWSGMRHCLTALAQAGLDVNKREGNGYTPLMLAAMRGNAEAVEVLLALGADASLTRDDASTALSLATEGKASYDKRNHFAYKLIYFPNRARAYTRTVKLLTAGSASAAPLTREQLTTLMTDTVRKEQENKKKTEDAQDNAQQEQLEQKVEKAAAAPPDTDGAQAPSAQVE